VVIANGSTEAIPLIPGLDIVEIWTNRQAAIPRELPASMAILGGGAIGVELGQAFARLGSKETVIEAGPTFLGLEEPEGAALRPHLEADGITLIIGDPCIAVEKQFGGIAPRLGGRAPLKSGAVVSGDRLLVATGRRPNVEAWRATGLAQTERGWLKVDPANRDWTKPGELAGKVARRSAPPSRQGLYLIVLSLTVAAERTSASPPSPRPRSVSFTVSAPGAFTVYGDASLVAR
jgi:pyruvate/2-oxoglutarate dehydrogenase complex dihydrolipoamide dehydrogenase (E3) component